MAKNDRMKKVNLANRLIGSMVAFRNAFLDVERLVAEMQDAGLVFTDDDFNPPAPDATTAVPGPAIAMAASQLQHIDKATFDEALAAFAEMQTVANANSKKLRKALAKVQP